MLYAHFAEISEKNAHIRIKLTCLIRMFERESLLSAYFVDTRRLWTK